MALVHGSRLGPYEILAPLGAGGMGEVYRAKDTRLGRTVAIKVLPAHLAEDEELRRRLEREARMISRLSHPNICSLFDVGHENSTHYLVMEYLEGETLAQRLKKGALPAEQILRYGAEMAGALDAAHRDGIVHRDLKPGNVMLTKGGVKLLDFGLAKPERGEAKTNVAATATQTEYSLLTEAGHVPGTVPYMAPEQLNGKRVDSRTDIFALGVVLYEMATGRRAFEGETRTDLVTAILDSEPPPVSVFQPKLPPGLGQVIKRCMAKDPDERWQTARDIAAQLGWVQEEGSRAGSAVAPRRKSIERLAAIVAAAAVFWALILTVGPLRRAPPASPVVRFSIPPPANTSFGFAFGDVGAAAPPVISPDGRWLVFGARDSSGTNLLWLRPLNSFDARPLPGTDDAGFPFWSPDSRFVGFFAGRESKLKKIAISGGPPQTICDSPRFRGATWGPGGVILFAPAPDDLDGLYKIQDTGGRPAPVTWPADSSTTHRWPAFLPDGRHFLYLSATKGTGPYAQEPYGIFLGSLDSKETKLVLPDASNALYAPPGYLLFVREKTLMAIPFDLKRLQTKGSPIPIDDRVRFDLTRWRGVFSASTTGVLAYAPAAGVATSISQLRWIDRTGRTLGTEGPPADYQDLTLSLDDRKAALVVRDPVTNTADIWIRDFSSGIQTRLTFGANVESSPVWSPDGRFVVYAGGKSGRLDMYRSAADGSGEPEPFAQSDDHTVPLHWSDDGRFLAFARIGKGKGSKVETWVYSVQDRKATPFLQGRFDYQGQAFSPDGRWFAYTSDESGQLEVYVRPFPGPGGRWQVSKAGARGGAGWRQDGRELIYASLEGIVSVPVIPGPAFEIGVPRPLFSFPSGWSLSDTHDFQRFLVVAALEDRSPALIQVTLNWSAGLKE